MTETLITDDARDFSDRLHALAATHGISTLEALIALSRACEDCSAQRGRDCHPYCPSNW